METEHYNFFFGDADRQHRVGLGYQESHEKNRDSTTLLKGLIDAFDYCTFRSRDAWTDFNSAGFRICLNAELLGPSNSTADARGK